MIATSDGDSLKIKGDFLRAMHRCRGLPCPVGIARVRKSLLQHGSGAIKVEAVGLRLLAPSKTFAHGKRPSRVEITSADYNTIIQVLILI